MEVFGTFTSSCNKNFKLKSISGHENGSSNPYPLGCHIDNRAKMAQDTSIINTHSFTKNTI